MKFIKKTDILVIAALAVIGFGVWLFYQYYHADQPVRAEIYFESQLVETVKLTEGTDRVFSIPQRPNVLIHQFPDKSIRFEESDCPDQICVRTGRISRAGESAACLPNGVIIKLVSDVSDGPDIVIG